MKHVETATERPLVVLVTGFGAFPGARKNPSAAIVDRLKRHRGRLTRLGIALETSLLPVIFDQVGPALEAVAKAKRPDAILHLGLASRRRGISIETRALNRAGPLHPDAAGRRAAQRIQREGPARQTATYPVARLAAAIGTTGVPARRSIDAGDYVCNTTLYLTLANRLAPRAGFLHVPKTLDPARPLKLRRHRPPTLDALTRAVLTAVVVLGCETRRDRLAAASLPSPRRRDGASAHR